MSKREGQRGKERNTGRECVCSCALVCPVQSWFKAPGHRKKTALHSRHVPVTSSRGSTIAIQQRQLQTPKWVCSVLQCLTWHSATDSSSLAPNMPTPYQSHFFILSSNLSFLLPFHSCSLTSPHSILPSSSLRLLVHSLSVHAVYFSTCFSFFLPITLVNFLFLQSLPHHISLSVPLLSQFVLASYMFRSVTSLLF